MEAEQMRKSQDAKRGLLDLIALNFKDRDNLIALEIGSYAGESAQLCLSTGRFKEIYCIDPWETGYDPNDPTSRTVAEAEKVFDSRFKNEPRIHKIKAYSFDKIDDFSDSSFDFIYVDGNHQEAAVEQDLKMVLPKLKQDGVLAGHDYNPRARWVRGVSVAVDRVLQRKPEHVFPDTSWSCRKSLIKE